MAPKATISRSKQPSKPSKEKQVVTEQSPQQQEIEEEDPEEEEEFLEDENEDDDLPRSTEPKSGSVHLNGFVSDSGSDSDSDDSNSGYKVQPIPKPPITSPAKRPGGSSDGQPSKKPKPNNPNGKKSSSVSRIWNKDDEIIVLREMNDFKKSKGLDLNLELVAFYDSLKGKLHGDYSKEQLRTKIRHMRTKYVNIMTKCEKGSDPAFSNPHEALVFDLSKKAWGDVKGKKSVNGGANNGVHETAVNENGVDGKKDGANVEVENVVMVDEKGEKEVVEEKIFVPHYKFLRESIDELFKYHQSLGLSDATIRLMKDNLYLIGKANASELDDEWKELLMEEVELNHKRASLVKKQIELVFDGIKKRNVG